MINVIAFSGKKQSGKNTAINFIAGIYMIHLNIVRGQVKITNKGKLHITDLFGNTNFAGCFDICRKDNAQIIKFLEEHIHPFVKVYSFADPLKEMCMNMFNLTYQQCYGTDEDKNSLTQLKWENMLILNHNKTGFMTAREVLQYIGTDIFRKMYYNVWVNTTIKKIQKEKTDLALIPDCRFPNELNGIKNIGGKVIRLTRNPHNDNHESETILDKDKFDWNNFDIVLDNSNMSIPEQNETLYNILKPWKCIPEVS